MVNQAKFVSSITNPRPSPASSATLEDESALTKLSIRGKSAGEALGVDFPQAVRHNGVLVAAIRPDEWLLLGNENDVKSWLASTNVFEGDSLVSQFDISHSRLCLRLSGERSRSVLAKICSLDFDELMFPNGATGSASVAKVSSDLIRDDSNSDISYLILADRSFGQYFYDAILDATSEFASIPS